MKLYASSVGSAMTAVTLGQGSWCNNDRRRSDGTDERVAVVVVEAVKVVEVVE